MYVRDIEVRDVKCFKRLSVDFTDKHDPSGVRRWTVILGPNGLGKSTLLQAIAVCLAGPNPIRELLPRPEAWPRHGRAFGQFKATILWTEGDAQLPRWPKKSPYEVNFAVTGDDLERLPESLRPAGTETLLDWSGEGTPREREAASKSMSRLKQTAYAEDKTGWLACGYGPFRRLSGGSPAADQILYADRRAARFVSLFREDAALSRAVQWLIQLHNLGRDGDQHSFELLQIVQEAFRADFLLKPAELDVDARGASLRLEGHSPVPLTALSDGYRAMLALGLDLLRHLLTAFPASEDPLGEPGVVLIDELDAHLHANWQRLIGSWLLDKFPRLQFVIATHSPFLTQVWPESNFLLNEARDGTVTITHDPNDVTNWTVDQVMTELLGLASARSVTFESSLTRYATLRRIRNRNAEQDQEFAQLSLWAENALGHEDSARQLVQSLLERLEPERLALKGQDDSGR